MPHEHERHLLSLLVIYMTTAYFHIINNISHLYIIVVTWTELRKDEGIALKNFFIKRLHTFLFPFLCDSRKRNSARAGVRLYKQENLRGKGQKLTSCCKGNYL